MGDNGQGKTTFLRTIVDSLPRSGGRSSLGPRLLRSASTPSTFTRACRRTRRCMNTWKTRAPGGTKTQEILNGAASLLFRGPDVKKKVSVLSGGERARLCLAGLMLSQYNVLVLDEPGNHLDVETRRLAGRGPVGLQGDRHLHQPRPLLHETDGDIDHRGPRRPGRELSAATTRPICTPSTRKSRRANARRPRGCRSRRPHF